MSNFKEHKPNIIGLLLGAIAGFFAGKAINKHKQTEHAQHWGAGLGAIIGWFLGGKMKK